MEQIQVEIGHNPYANYDPAGLLRAWGIEQSSVQRNVKAVGQAIENRQPTDPPIGVDHVVRALRDNRQRMGQIHEVALGALEAMRVYCCGENKQTVIAYSVAIGETALTSVAAAIQIWNASKEDGDPNSWWPLGIVTVSGFASIVKNYAWEKKVEAEVDLAKVESTITAAGLKFVDGMIDSLNAMGKMSRESESVSENELERRLRQIGRMPANSGIGLDTIMGQVCTTKDFAFQAGQQGEAGRLRTLAGLVVQRQKRTAQGNIDDIALRELQDGESHNWHQDYKIQSRRRMAAPTGGYKPDASEEERRVQLWKDFVEPTCCGYLVNVLGIEAKALQLRQTLDQQVEAAGESDEQRDFSILTQLLQNIAAEGRNDVLFVLDRFLREEGVWQGKPISKVKTWTRVGAHYLTQVATMVLLGVSAYKSNNDEKNMTLEVASTVGIIASLILGKYTDMMYRSLVERRVREGKLRGLRRHVLKTISQAGSLGPFFQRMQDLRQRSHITESDTEQALLGARIVPRRFRMIANSCLQDVVVPRSPSDMARQGPKEGSLLGEALADLWTDHEEELDAGTRGVAVSVLEPLAQGTPPANSVADFAGTVKGSEIHAAPARIASEVGKSPRERKRATVESDSEDEMIMIRGRASKSNVVAKNEEVSPARSDQRQGLRRRNSKRPVQIYNDSRETDSDIELEMRIIDERQNRESQAGLQLAPPRGGRPAADEILPFPDLEEKAQTGSEAPTLAGSSAIVSSSLQLVPVVNNGGAGSSATGRTEGGAYVSIV